MQEFSLGLESQIDGVYLSCETIDLLNIIQSKDIDELKQRVEKCSQLDISIEDMQEWNNDNLEQIKKDIVEKYKDTFISMEESIKSKEDVLMSVLLHSGINEIEIDSYMLTFKTNGYQGIIEKLKNEHFESYNEFSKKAHEFIASERDQIKSVTYEELTQINDNLSNHNTILIASGRYYDVTKRTYDKEIPQMEKYDFYHQKNGLDFCFNNGMYARYHTLLDKQTMEEKLRSKSKEEVLNELRAFIKESIDFINDYNKTHKIDGKGVINSVDLCNEMISFDEPYKNMWKEIYGITNEDLFGNAEKGIEGVFSYAVKNKPEGVTYVYNEPFLENEERRKVVLEQLKEMNSLCPNLIDTIGTQMHITMKQDINDIKKCFEDLKNTGLNAQITEFDMCMPEEFMFDGEGKVRTEEEIVELINQKSGGKFQSVSELKNVLIKRITDAIQSTGIELEGVTYWSINDTLDHNLERTNRSTIENGLSRGIANTRYSGLYPSLAVEKLKTESREFTDKSSIDERKEVINRVIKKLKQIEQYKQMEVQIESQNRDNKGDDIRE